MSENPPIYLPPHKRVHSIPDYLLEVPEPSPKAFPRVESKPGIRGGEPCLAGTRIPAAQVYESWVALGYEETMRLYDLTEQEVAVCVRWGIWG